MIRDGHWRVISVTSLAVVVVIAIDTMGLVMGVAIACGFIGAYGLGAESGTDAPSAEELKEARS